MSTQTLRNINGARISKRNRCCRVAADALGWTMDRWRLSDDIHYSPLVYAVRPGAPADIFRDMEQFLGAPFEECDVEIQQAADLQR